MEYSPSERPKELGSYLIAHKSTVRAVAKVFGISKSTVHKDITEKLEKSDRSMWEEVKKILEINKAERHIRGGNATRLKYASAKSTKIDK